MLFHYCHIYLTRIRTVLSVFFLLLACYGAAQPYTTIDLKKEKPYDNRRLPAEKSGEKKFTLPKRIYNNTVTHFNYYYNANLRLNEILERAREAHRDDYTQLLSFYDYDLETTAQDQIDTVLYKCTAGILLHDLRSDWVDNLYMLMGKAYFYRKNFDSAGMVFQYVNYAFAPKDDGYDILLGSNSSNPNGIFTISTNEKRNFWQKITTTLPSRNESFIWQARTYIEQQKMAEAAGLIALLRSDSQFPKRLQPALDEASAYLFYQMGIYDSAAVYLTRALPNAENKTDRARWEYLAGQLFQRAGHSRDAAAWFNTAIQHATDPYMEVYARLNIAQLMASDKEDALEQNIQELLKMARKDRYDVYRDIIYYAAAQLEIRRNRFDAATALLLKSVSFSNDNPVQKQLSFLSLGDLHYDQKKYATAFRYYDSTELRLLPEKDQVRVNLRKPALQVLAENESNINREDSVQRIAALPPAEREAVLRKLLRQLRKEKGLKDTDEPASFGSFTDTKNSSGDLFGNNTSNDFYFLNSSLRSKGVTEFKTRWGNRPNTDNWRRQSAIDQSGAGANQAALQADKPGGAGKLPAEELSMDALLNAIPLTAAQQDISNTLIFRSLEANGTIFMNQLEDYSSAIGTYESILRRYPDSGESETALFNLMRAYRKAGRDASADSVEAIFKQRYANSKLLTAPVGNQPKTTDPATQTYTAIYNAFIEGRFADAIAQKNKADQVLGNSYWTPQLLYIEAIYYVKQREDSTAINRLTQLQQLFSSSPMAEKAAAMIDVLRRRSEIESYLTQLQVERPIEATVMPDIDFRNTGVINTTVTGKDSSTSRQAPKTVVPAAVTIRNETKAQPLAPAEAVYEFNAADTQYAVVVLNKVDPVFAGEVRNAFSRYNQERYANQRLVLTMAPIQPDIQYLLVGPFVNAGAAVDYADRAKALAASRIIPWLTVDKYRFQIISPANLELLKKKKDAEAYRNFLQTVLPDKF
ncbi:MAG: hypothetical protein GXC72_06385 [Chitinophagaceae bacterium]|nr:hypothetical protein [Chitinophagaceae bacterium]